MCACVREAAANMLRREKAIMYSLGDVQTSSKGIRSAPLTDESGSSVFIVACRETPLTAPFGASAYNDQAASRKNICFGVLTSSKDNSKP